jgi:hypothetical protein
MAKRSFQVPTWTPTAVADTTNLANNTFMSIGASGATAGLNVIEIYMGGQATASAVNIMMFARDSTVAVASPVVAPVSDGPLDTRTAALAAVPITATSGTTLPQRSAALTAARLNLSFNAFGGVVKWTAIPGEEWGITGVTVNVSESSLSAFTGGNVGLMGSHIIYEPFIFAFCAVLSALSLLSA